MIIEIRDIPQGTGVQRIQIDLMPLAQAATLEVMQYDMQPVAAGPSSQATPPSSAKPQEPDQAVRPAKPIPQEMTDLEL